MEGWTDIFFGIVWFLFFMGVPFLPYARKSLDYAKRTWFVMLWFTLGVLTLFYTTSVETLLVTSDVSKRVLLAGSVVLLTVVFAHFWQSYGRPYMPRNSFVDDTTTFYAFTKRYALAKILEIYFQGLAAGAILLGIFTLTNSILMTAFYFGLVFFAAHIVGCMFLGKEWLLFIVIATFVAASIPTVLLLVMPAGFLVLFSFHLLMYLLFLIAMRRYRISRVLAVR